MEHVQKKRQDRKEEKYEIKNLNVDPQMKH